MPGLFLGDSVESISDVDGWVGGWVGQDPIPAFCTIALALPLFQILNSMNIPYETVDVLVDPDLREGVQLYSGSPGVPQLYVNGEFMGGAEAMVELYQTGELQEAIEIGMLS